MIPRTVHRLWLGGPEPSWLKSFGESWLRPGWKVVQWTDHVERYERYGRDDDHPVLPVDELFPLTNQDLYDRAAEIAPDHVGQLRSDILRYELLFRFGGVWVDCDLECLRPIDDLLEGIGCFAAWEVQHRWIGNTILGCTPGHPAMEALINGLPGNVRRRAGSRPNKLSGPQYVSRVLRTRLREVTVFDQELFYPFGWESAGVYVPGEVDVAESWPKARTAHWWANQRREKGLPSGPA